VTRPRLCAGCASKPVAASGHSQCFDCLPGGPYVPPPCRRCGSSADYYSAGLCRRCHRLAPLVVDSCRDCLAWGVTRASGWICQGCKGWRKRFRTTQQCPSCRRHLALNAEGVCRLCWRQAALVRLPRQHLSVIDANQYGQQLFFADLFRQQRTPGPGPAPIRPALRPGDYPVTVTHRQLVLFDLARDLAAFRHHQIPELPELPDPQLAALLDQVAHDHATGHGWSRTRLNAARQAIRVLLAIQDTPGAPIRASDVTRVDQLGLAVQPVLDVLTTAGMLHDDRPPSIDAWFARHIDGLPEPMLSEVLAWFDALCNGSTTPPRLRPRSPKTARLRIHHAMPVLRAWANAGHGSLREITRDDIREALPAEGTARSLIGQSLRSLFRVLKGRKIVFADPTARIRTGRPETRDPLPLELTVLREALTSTDPARAALAALVAFHAPRNGELHGLHLTDVRDGRLRLPERTVPLAEPVQARIAAWLDHRARRWPRTVNPHLFINTYTGVRTGPVSQLWINQTIGLSAQAVREDRILHEAIATGGDIRRLIDLFGLSVAGAERYARVVHEPDLDDTAGFGSRTHGPS
jgi:hypothetical protein